MHVNKDGKERFSDRVDDYRKYRPGYPPAVLTVLAERCGLGPASVVADIGSGTGILTARLLDQAAVVHAVEPNAPMRAAAEAILGHHPDFRSVAGSAEATTLPDDSVDLVTAAQAFHWFDPVKAKAEFHRILRRKGNVSLIWNERMVGESGFSHGYEALLREQSEGYRQTVHRSGFAEETVREFYLPGKADRIDVPTRQEFDFDGVRGRLLSSSYAPKAGHPDHDKVFGELRRLFDRHAVDGRVAFAYTTRIFVPA